MICMLTMTSWAVKSIKGLEAYQLTVQDDMYYNHGLIMNQKIDIHRMLAGDVNLQLRLKDAALKAFANHGIKRVELVENCRRNFKGTSQNLIKQIESVRKNTYKKRGQTPPPVEYGILPTPIIQFSRELTPIELRVPYQLKRVVDEIRKELEYLKPDGNTTSAAHLHKPIHIW